MKDEDRQAFRVFYQTLAKGSTTKDQQDLYTAMMGGKNARIAWLKKQAEINMEVPAEIVTILTTTDFTKADIAYILAAKIAEDTAPIVADKTQGVIQSIFNALSRLLPWNWGKR